MMINLRVAHTNSMYGSRLTKVSDSAADVVYTGAADFVDGADSATEYTYDSDGRLLSDANKGITSIKYNALGLPAVVTFADGSSITNRYSAAGTLLQRVKTEPVKTITPLSLTPVLPAYSKSTVDNHIGALTLRKNALHRINTPTGYFADGAMHYYIKDYQGNVRQVTDADGAVEQDNHYYPYGMLMGESSDILTANTSATANPYLYGSKEYITTAGANLLDFTARTYDPSLPLFHTQDPLSGDYTSYLPYLYCGGDPINRVDFSGKDWYTIDTDGYLVNRVSKDTDQFFLRNENGNISELTNSYEKGTFDVSNYSSSDKSVKILSIKLNGNSIGTEVFEALACNTDVEWSLIQADNLSTGVDEENYIGTSHTVNEEYGAAFHLKSDISPSAHMVYEIIHSHPSGSEGPSGVKTGGDDIGFARKYEKIYSTARFGILVTYKKEYIYFNSSSKQYDFNFKGGELPPLEVTFKRK